MKFFRLKCIAFINICPHVGIFHRSKTTGSPAFFLPRSSSPIFFFAPLNLGACSQARMLFIVSVVLYYLIQTFLDCVRQLLGNFLLLKQLFEILAASSNF